MNRSQVVALIGIMLTLQGCSTEPPPIDPEAVVLTARFGPAPPPPPSGGLRVKTEMEVVASGDGDDIQRWVHSGYDLFDADGRFVRHVANHISSTDGGLMTVTLTPGKYFIAIPDGHRPSIWVEVTIEEGRLTYADVTGLKAR